MRARLLRLRSELNNTRLTLLVTLLFTMLVATIFPTPAIRFTVALFCAGPFVSFFMAQFFARSLRASRTIPATATVGDLIHGRVVVSNTAPYPIFFAQVKIGESAAPEGEMVPIEAQDGVERVFATLKPGEHVALPVHWKANRRGVWQFSPVLTGATDPLGLSSVLTARSAPQTITVLPRPLHVMKLGFLTGSRNGTRPISHAASVNEAMDFHGIRTWRPGEGMRRVHWKSTARTGELHVIEWEEDLSADLIVLLDVQVDPGHPAGAMHEQLETGITIAASVASYLLANGNSFELFYWQASQNLAAASKKNKEPIELKLCRHRSRGMGGLSSTLQLLAEIQPLPMAEASLVNLVERASVNREFNILLLTMGQADISDTVNRLYRSGVPSRQCTVLSLEPEGEAFVTSPGENGKAKDSRARKHKMGSVSNTKRADAPKTPNTVTGVRTRRVRQGESLTALLEKD